MIRSDEAESNINEPCSEEACGDEGGGMHFDSGRLKRGLSMCGGEERNLVNLLSLSGQQVANLTAHLGINI